MSGEQFKRVNALPPVADAYASDPGCDVVSMSKWNRWTAVIQEGVGTTGTAKVTVDACDDFTPSNTSAIPFRYKTITSGDTESAWQSASVPATGFTTTAGSNHMYVIEIVSADLPDGYPNVRLKLEEVADDPVLAGVTYTLSEPRYASDQNATVIA